MKKDKIGDKLFKILIFITIMVFINLVLNSLLFSKIKNGNKDNKYDVSMMKSVSVNDILGMFDDQKTHVLYIGRGSCKLCVTLLPVLKTAQIDLNFITSYIDITEIDRTNPAWDELVKKLDMKILDTASNEKQTFGYFLNKKGYTPCVIVIANGKQKSGFFGTLSLNSYKDWLIKNGI